MNGAKFRIVKQLGGECMPPGDKQKGEGKREKGKDESFSFPFSLFPSRLP